MMALVSGVEYLWSDPDDAAIVAQQDTSCVAIHLGTRMGCSLVTG